MEWLNIFGFVFIVVIIIPNIIFAIKYKDAFEYRNFAGSQLEPFIKQAIALSIFANSTDIICNYDITSAKIKELANERTVINVNQGYTKCSVCAVSDKAFITDDKSIYKALKNAEYDVLEVEKGSVALDGYDYGFIGGACCKISKDVLAFFGNAKAHKCYEDIKAFCKNYNVDLLSLDNKRLCDIGSFIPIFENE